MYFPRVFRNNTIKTRQQARDLHARSLHPEMCHIRDGFREYRGIVVNGISFGDPAKTGLVSRLFAR